MARPRGADKRTSEALEQLYAAAPEEFVAERKRLERELKDAGDTEAAADVAGRKKPTLPVFAANRLARKRAADVERLIDAAARIAKATESSDREAVRDAQAEFAERLRDLVHGAEESAGRPLSETAEQRLASLLRAAAVDPDSAPLLRRGILSDELEPAGFDALLGLSLTAAPKRGASTSETDARSRRAEEQQAKAAQLERDLGDARATLRHAESELLAAQRQADRARRHVADLEDRLQRARDAADP
jgi:hypothetical protein